MQIVNLRHPGYDDKVNILLTLQAPDDPNGGIHHQTARLACCIVAGNRWDGFLSVTQDNPIPVNPQEYILKRKDYYFFLPDFIVSAQNAQTPQPTIEKKKPSFFGKKSRDVPAPIPTSGQLRTSTKYPITARFEDWKFPTRDLPPLWNDVEDVFKLKANSKQKDVRTDNKDESKSRFVTTERCRLCGSKEYTREVMIWPKEFRRQFSWIGRACQIYKELFDPEKDEDEEEDRYDKLRDDRNNLYLGVDCELEDEHRDAVEAYNNAQFLFVPKLENKGSPKMTAHIFGTVDHGVQHIHDTPLLNPEAASVELLFVRFAWACFKQLAPFMNAGVSRLLNIETHSLDVVTLAIRGDTCDLLARDKFQLWKEKQSVSETEPDIYKSSLQQAFDDERQNDSKHIQNSEGKTMVTKWDYRTRHDASCSVCKKPIYGARWHCLQCETGYDCCDRCFRKRKLNSWKHALQNHEFTMITRAAFLEKVKTDELIDEDEVSSDEEALNLHWDEIDYDTEEEEITPLDKFINTKATYKRDLIYYELPPPTDDTKWIRIFTLWPGKGFEPIVAHLETSELSAASTFEALSYTWGDPGQSATITVSGSSLQVTHNLKVALSYLRHPERPRRLWIDAICIYQDDLEERAQQVTIMRDIYRRAYRTIIWLGAEDEDKASKAFQVCDDVWKRHGTKYFNDNLKHLATDSTPLENLRAANDRLDKRIRTLAKVRLIQNGQMKNHAAIDEYINENQIELSRIRDEWLDVYMRTGTYPPMRPDENVDIDDDVSSVEDPPKSDKGDGEVDNEEGDKDQSDDSSEHSDISEASRAWSDDDMYLRLNQLVESLDGAEQPQNATTEPAIPDLQEITILRELFDRPWFGRIWIIQEAGMARSAVFQCASVKTDWFVLGFGYGLLMDLHQGSVFQLDYDRPVFHMSETRDLLVRARKYGETLKELQLPFLLRRYRASEATDPHDKVYALMGISQTNLTKYGFVPDYTREVEDTYKLVMMHLLNEYKNLDLLSVHRVPGAPVSILPTWVPDWSDTTRQPWPFVTNLSGDIESLTLDKFNQRVFNAAKDSVLTVPVVVDDQKQRLTLQGYTICTVAQLAEPMFFEEQNLDFLTLLSNTLAQNDDSRMAETVSEMKAGLKFVQTLQEWEKMAGINDSNRADSAEIKAYVRILTTEVDITMRKTDPITEYLMLYRTATAILSAINACQIGNTNKRLSRPHNPQVPQATGKEALETLEDQISDLLPKSGKSFAQALSYMSYIYSRRLFRSSDGRLGLAPTFTNRGDQIMLLEGGSVPLVLRPATRANIPKGSAYEVVGECYLVGAMHGELWDVSKCGGVVLV